MAVLQNDPRRLPRRMIPCRTRMYLFCLLYSPARHHSLGTRLTEDTWIPFQVKVV